MGKDVELRIKKRGDKAVHISSIFLSTIFGEFFGVTAAA